MLNLSVLNILLSKNHEKISSISERNCFIMWPYFYVVKY